VRILFRETPGHTPESISIIVFDKQKSSDTPYAVLTGDTLFIGDVGRPDLMASVGWTSEQLAGKMYDSLHQKLMILPDETLVYPAHGAGSLCGKNLSKETVSTIGTQRITNYAVQPMTKEEFIAMLTAEQPDAPNYFGYDAALNTQERRILEDILDQTVMPLSIRTVLDLQKEGAQILDTRDPLYYAAAHLAGSINIGLNGQYATWAGTVLDHSRPVVIIADTDEERAAIMRLGRIGFDNIAGYLESGMSAGIPEQLIEQTTHIDVEELAKELAASNIPVIDVRGPGEWRAKRIEGSVNIPLNHLQERMRELPKGSSFVLHCQTGYRSSIAASILQHAGINNFKELVGGLAACRPERFSIVVS
ncbi:MAG TPA: rhodanese-like domain-containing protein, partial [Candidatus Kapabacteria bacterium]|nr:rhodanese-like domain-containing protein [Candidatus Kapabacteria bacterium]